MDGKAAQANVASEVAAGQWAAWRANRRRLLQVGALGGAGIALGTSGRGVGVARVAAQEEPKMGGTITMSLADNDIQSFDPIAVFDNMSIWTDLLIYDQLIRVAADGLSLEPGLAESWEVRPDALTYTFHLRQAAFHDGTPCTSADVVYSLNRAVFDESSVWAFLFTAVETIEAPDPATVVITLKSVWVPFEADLAMFAASIVPKAAHEAEGDDLWQNPIGTGPFMFESWEKEVECVLVKNPTYWDPPKPYLDKLVFKVLTDSNARTLQFQAGDLDIVTSIPPSQREALQADPDIVLLTDDVARIDYMALNLLRPPLDDRNLRQAINYAVDVPGLITNVLFGAAVQANTFLPLMPYHADDIAPYPYDVAKANELVAQSAAKDGFELELLLAAGNSTGSQIAQLVSAALAEIGGKITVVQVEPATAVDLVTKEKNYDISFGYYTTDIVDPDELATFAVLSDGGTEAVWTSYKNEEVDALIRAAQSETDVEKRRQMYHDIQQLHRDDAPFLFLTYPTGSGAIRSYVKNFRILPTGNYRLYETWRDDA